ncbi:MAG: hypothetical protein WCD83_05270 [Pseudolabrys sp.]
MKIIIKITAALVAALPIFLKAVALLPKAVTQIARSEWSLAIHQRDRWT